MGYNIISDNSILDLNCDSDINKLLLDNKIQLIKELWILKKEDLKKMGLDSNQINQICIKLQLLGLDLNHKKYRI